MKPQRFDALSRSMAGGVSRRHVLAGLGIGGVSAWLGGRETLNQATLAQEPACHLDVTATVRIGPNASTIDNGLPPGERRATVNFTVGDSGTIENGQWLLADGTGLPLVGQITGRAVNLRVDFATGQPLVLVGTAAQDMDPCSGLVDGLLTGPQAGDLGDWHAIPLAAANAGPTTGQTAGAAPTQQVVPTATSPPIVETPGTPEPSCPAGSMLCDDACIDVMGDPDNCGGCGDFCRTDEICQEGRCIETPCPDFGGLNLTACGRVCADLAEDQSHCGACDNACPPGYICSNGACEEDWAPCPPNVTDCGNGACADLGSHPNHCGECNRSCLPGDACCAGQCFDLQNDATHCGSCHIRCWDGQSCQNGECVDLRNCETEGLTTCPGDPNCVDLLTNPFHCGTCDINCQGLEVCINGVCSPRQ